MMRAGAWAARARRSVVAASLAAALLSACGANPVAVGPAGIDQLTIPTPSPDPADFAGHAENVWFPLDPGTQWTYRQYLPTGFRTVVATVLTVPREIAGVSTTAVRWQLGQGGRSRTAMVRWYAVDSAGNVWWFGQRVAPHEPRLDLLAPRSWQAGVDGAEAGLLLTATPRLGDGYLNAGDPGVVERRSTVDSVDATVVTAEHEFQHTVVTRDLSSLVPLHVVQTYYARGLGLVAQQDTRVLSTSLSLVRMRDG